MIATGIVAQALEAPKCPECGADLPSGGEPLAETTCSVCNKKVMVPGRLGQYHLLRLIGAGGMGAVYEGIDTGLQRKIAVKVILRDKAEEDPTFIESFKREAQAAARLNSVNIVGVYAFGESEGQPYLVMELVQPDALDKMMKSGPVDAVTVLSIGKQIAQGLKAAAEHGLVHGDVKPENILINEAREAKLADFGIAALAGAKAAANNEVWGTPYYIAPETLRRQKVDLRADIYSLGATLYHAIAGVPPFEGETAVDVMKARLLGPARPLTEVVPGCPEAIAKIVMRMLEAEPTRRYPNYDSLLADIAKELPAKGGAKRVMLKGVKSKSATTSVQIKPSQPMKPVENPNAPLFETKKKGLSKGALIGIGVGAGVACLAVLGVIIGVVIKAATASELQQTQQGVVAESAAGNTAEALRLKAEAEALTALGTQLEQRYTEQIAARKRAGEMLNRMVKRAERAVLPAHSGWLSAQEGEAPTAMLATLQQMFGCVAQMDAAVTATERLRTQMDDWRVNREDVSAALAEASAAVQTYDALPEVKAFAANVKLLNDTERNWQRIVTKARTEMEAEVARQLEAERVAKEAERAREAAEKAKREIEEEVASVAAIEVAITGDLDKFMPESAAVLFKNRQARLKSDEAKAAAEVVAERIAAYQQLKTAWVEMIKAGRFKSFGIVAADESTVTRGGKQMPWQQFVSGQQSDAFKMIRFSIIDDANARGMRASERAELAIGAYLFINKYFGSGAIEKSKALREAMQKLQALAESLPGTRAAFERLTGADAAPAAE